MNHSETENQSPSQPRVRIIRHLLQIFLTAAVIATVFTIFTPLGLTFGLGERLDVFNPPGAGETNPFLPTPTRQPKPRIGIVVGHWGRPDDVGAVCPDGLTELDVNLEVATRVQQLLQTQGFDVDLLKENDELLPGYRAMTLVSIHADSCVFYGNEATGFKVTSSLGTSRPDKANRLVACIYSRYAEATLLPYHNALTEDMTSYHAFEEIDPDTAAAIIETGFLNLDRVILTQSPDLVAGGIANGILCYIRNEDASPPENLQP